MEGIACLCRREVSGDDHKNQVTYHYNCDYTLSQEPS